MQGMAKIIALSKMDTLNEQAELLRRLLVTGCALALILAGHPFPLPL